MRKVIAGVIQALSWIVYLVLTIALLVTAPLVLGNHPVVVLSGSMEPVYPVGSIIYYKQADFDDIDVGDAITFRIGEGSLATHRVVEKDEESRTFSTKGDANLTADAAAVAYDNVVGKTSILALPFVGYFTKIIQRWYVIGGMGLVLLLNMLVTPEKAGAAEPKAAEDAAKAARPRRQLRRVPTAAQYFKDF